MLTDAITGSGEDSYELIRTETYFTLYDNSAIRRAKLVIEFPSTKISFGTGGTIIGSILPCNPPSADILLVSNSRGNIKALASGNLCGGYTSTATEYSRTYANGTYYWTY